MEGGQKRDGEEEEETNRYMEELQKLISSSTEHHGSESVTGISFTELDRLNFGTNTNLHQPGPYHEKLRSYSSLSVSSALSDTSSQCTNNEMMETTYHEYSLSDGGGAGQRRSLRFQPRQCHGKGHANRDFSGSAPGPSRRSYECDICERRFPSPQSLGGHKNLHRPNRGKGRGSGSGSGSRQRYRGAPVVEHTGGSGTNSSESESVATIYKGVRCREGGKWVTEIRPPKSTDKWWLGTFDSAEEAAQAYDIALTFFKSESELNFGDHPLYHDLPKLQLDLSPRKFATALRDMVKEVSDKIVAGRLEEQATRSASRAAVIAADSSSSSAPTTLQDQLQSAAAPPPPPPGFVTPGPDDPTLEWGDQWINDLDSFDSKST